jgi:hypothetical protein
MTKTTTVNDLRAKIAALEDSKIILEAERGEISYAAHVEKNSAATKRLAAINSELANGAAEITSLQAALNEANRRDAAAKAAQLDGKERDAAAAALGLLDTFAKRGAALDEAFDKLIAEYVALSDEFRQLENLKFAPTSHRMVHITMRTALLTKLMGTDLKIQHLAPGERKSFEGAIGGWSASIRSRAQARLNHKTADAA